MSAVRIYAHRGASAELPENTMAAFRRAVELGVDALELDIHATRDGVLVVSHDPDGRRMAGVAERLADLTFAEAQRWDVGGGERLPRFEDVVTEFAALPLNVDLKRDVADATVALLRRMRRRGARLPRQLPGGARCAASARSAIAVRPRSRAPRRSTALALARRRAPRPVARAARSARSSRRRSAGRG